MASLQENDAEQIAVEYVSAPREYEDLVNGTFESSAETANGHDNSARTGKSSLLLLPTMGHERKELQTFCRQALIKGS